MVVHYYGRLRGFFVSKGDQSRVAVVDARIERCTNRNVSRKEGRQRTANEVVAEDYKSKYEDAMSSERTKGEAIQIGFSLAESLKNLERHAEAKDVLSEVLSLSKRIHGAHHHGTTRHIFRLLVLVCYFLDDTQFWRDRNRVSDLIHSLSQRIHNMTVMQRLMDQNCKFITSSYSTTCVSIVASNNRVAPTSLVYLMPLPR